MKSMVVVCLMILAFLAVGTYMRLHGARLPGDWMIAVAAIAFLFGEYKRTG